MTGKLKSNNILLQYIEKLKFLRNLLIKDYIYTLLMMIQEEDIAFTLMIKKKQLFLLANRYSVFKYLTIVVFYSGL